MLVQLLLYRRKLSELIPLISDYRVSAVAVCRFDVVGGPLMVIHVLN